MKLSKRMEALSGQILGVNQTPLQHLFGGQQWGCFCKETNTIQKAQEAGRL